MNESAVNGHARLCYRSVLRVVCSGQFALGSKVAIASSGRQPACLEDRSIAIRELPTANCPLQHDILDHTDLLVNLQTL